MHSVEGSTRGLCTGLEWSRVWTLHSILCRHSYVQARLCLHVWEPCTPSFLTIRPAMTVGPVQILPRPFIATNSPIHRQLSSSQQIVALWWCTGQVKPAKNRGKRAFDRRVVTLGSLGVGRENTGFTWWGLVG